MVTESSIDEARRKAMRNGEEDPVIVAQRFLNIYRQMHIFPAERKEAFNKMLLELPVEVKGIFSSLPGGSILQDYIDDLSEKAGIQKTPKRIETNLSDDAHQQAQILATALAKAQAQAPMPQMAPVSAGPAKLSLDKDFASEFGKIMSTLLEQQTNLQRESLEKISMDLNKVQMFVAKNMQESKSEQQEQISSLCKAIIQSQTALQTTMSNVVMDQVATQSSQTKEEGGITKQLLKIVVAGQKQISTQLSRVEEVSKNQKEENSNLAAMFDKYQTALLQNLSESAKNPPIVNIERDDSKLIEVLTQNQENLMKSFAAAMQQNNTNNIQINASENSAQMMLLMEKMISMQAANEKNFENAISKAIEAQGKLYSKISRRQVKELAKIVGKGPRSASLSYDDEYDDEDFYDDDTLEASDTIAENYDTYEAEEKNDEKVKESIEDVSVKKKKKRRKKRKKDNQEDIAVDYSHDEAEIQNETYDVQENEYQEQKFEENIDLDDAYKTPKQEVSNLTEDAISLDEAIIEGKSDDTDDLLKEIEKTNTVDTSFFDIMFSDDEKTGTTSLLSDTSSDWGFGGEEEQSSIETANDDDTPQEDEEWEWAYVDEQEAEMYETAQAIGENSRIYSGDIYSQELKQNTPSITNTNEDFSMKYTPQIYDEGLPEDGDIDPYQNSILKD